MNIILLDLFLSISCIIKMNENNADYAFSAFFTLFAKCFEKEWWCVLSGHIVVVSKMSVLYDAKIQERVNVNMILTGISAYASKYLIYEASKDYC